MLSQKDREEIDKIVRNAIINASRDNDTDVTEDDIDSIKDEITGAIESGNNIDSADLAGFANELEKIRCEIEDNKEILKRQWDALRESNSMTDVSPDLAMAQYLGLVD